MITISARLFGFALATWHIKVPIDLPVFDYKPSIGPLSLEVTTGPMATVAPAHSVEATPIVTANAHAVPGTKVTPDALPEATAVDPFS